MTDTITFEIHQPGWKNPLRQRECSIVSSVAIENIFKGLLPNSTKKIPIALMRRNLV